MDFQAFSSQLVGTRGLGNGGNTGVVARPERAESQFNTQVAEYSDVTASTVFLCEKCGLWIAGHWSCVRTG